MDSKAGIHPYVGNVDDNGIRTLRCRQDLEHVLRRVVTEIEGRGLEISAVIDHNGDAADAGLDLPDSKLVVFGHVQRRTALMLAHPTLGLDLPMRLLIWRREDGVVFLTFNAAESLAARHGLNDDAADLLRVVADIAAAAAS